jgi:hypothetical protein
MWVNCEGIDFTVFSLPFHKLHTSSILHLTSSTIWALPSAQAIRSYCTGITRRPVSATILNAKTLKTISLISKIQFEPQYRQQAASAKSGENVVGGAAGGAS